MSFFELRGRVEKALKLQSQIECLPLVLLRKRSAGPDEFCMVSPRRDSRIMQVESLSLQTKPLSEMTEAELDDRLMETASRQSTEQKKCEIATLLAGIT